MVYPGEDHDGEITMRSTLVRGAVFAGAWLAAAALVAGCGGAAGSGGQGGAGPHTIAGLQPFVVARQAPDVTRAAGSARVEANMRMDLSGTTGDIRSTGSYDFAAQIGEFDSTATGGGLPDATGHAIVARNILYEQYPDRQRWARTDFSKLVNTPIGQQDPSQQLDLLRGVSDDAREVGTEQLRGTAVRHYAIKIDPVRLAAETTVVVPGSIVESAMKAAGPMPADVYVDEDGRVRKLAVSIDVRGANIDTSALGDFANDPDLKARLDSMHSSSDITIEYFDFGVPVSVQVPDPAQVVDGPLPLQMPR
jgi:hypothetical protein